MLLNDNEYSLQTIQDKTNITIEILERLSQKDWSHFKKPQLNGLISIIEREFNVDLSDLKDEANAYFKEHQDKEPECPIDLVDAATVGGSGSKILSNLITIVSLCAVGYAGWYYFVDKQQNNRIDANGTIYQSDSGMFTDTINSAKKILGISSDSNGSKNSEVVINSKPNSFNSIKKDNKVETVKKEEQTVEVRQELKSTVESNEKEQTIQKETLNEHSKSKPESVNSTEIKKFDITPTKQDSNSKETEIIEENSSKANSSKVVDSNNEVSSVVETSNTDSNVSIKTEVDSLLNELDTNRSKDKETNTTKTEEVATVLETNSSDKNSTYSDTVEKNTTASITKATFNLKSKRLWLGIYNLNRHKKVSKFIKKPFTLNVGEDKFAIVTGHNAFEIATDTNTKSFAKKGKVYFTIDKYGIEQLDRREYRKLTKRRAW